MAEQIHQEAKRHYFPLQTVPRPTITEAARDIYERTDDRTEEVDGSLEDIDATLLAWAGELAAAS